jgi:hypothetical protein
MGGNDPGAGDVDPGLPIKLNRCSNGEFVPPPPSPVVREAVRRARADADRNARRIGMSRRRFLLSSMGAATTLLALSACSDESTRASNATAPDGTRIGPGGSFEVPDTAAVDPDAAIAALGGNEFVFDVQTHFLDYSHDVPNLGVQFPQSNCGEADPRKCFSMDKYLDLLFNKSDTNIVILSALPFAGSPLNPDVMKKTIDTADRVCHDKRTLMQGEAHPSNGPIEGVLANMEQLHASLPVAAWKVYTHLGGPGWWLDDHSASDPKVGDAFLQKVRELGPNRVAVHKGFANGSEYADPVDVGPAAAAHGDLHFVVYHSGFDVGNPPERAYDEKDDYGVNRLITSVKKAGIGPGGNVFAELGSTWRFLMTNPDQAAHVLGKLLVTFGENNLCWGTDSIWYGAPQDQIQAFRTFQISREFQERYGYPELTPTLKAKIFGINSAALYGVDPITSVCRIDPADMDQLRQTSYEVSGDGNFTLGPTNQQQVAAVRAHEVRELDGTI